MDKGMPSRTAMMAAAYRAAHQTLDAASIFRDPHAVAILGAQADDLIEKVQQNDPRGSMRRFMALRSRFAEECLARALARGGQQVAVLGAGLDTLSLRLPSDHPGVRLFEIDHPVTQEWKRQRLYEAGLVPGDNVAFIPVDFTEGTLSSALAAGGIDWSRPLFCVWLGVVPYLEEAAIAGTLSAIGACPHAEIVFDYAEPLHHYPEPRRQMLETLAARAAELGEPWLSFFDRPGVAALLERTGFSLCEDTGMADLARRYGTTPEAGGPGPHVVHARVRQV